MLSEVIVKPTPVSYLTFIMIDISV